MEPKISFKNDYSEGAHPKILQTLIQTNLDQEPGYGDDNLSKKAKELIIQAIGNPKAQIYFVSGGTQANLLVVSHLLKSYESVISADTGHIEVHETGAIESSGHKINLISNIDGKISVSGIHTIVTAHTDNHMVKPRMVYLSQCTELGSLYSLREINEISKYCKTNNLLLFIDGARLATALTASANDVTLNDISRLADIFYIGGTKNGALLGEAIVFQNSKLSKDFDFTLKQKGALMAKGRILGAQFSTLFQGNLFFELGTHANKMAALLVTAFKNKGYNFASKPVSNQIFPIMPVAYAEALLKKYDFYIWQKLDNQDVVIRLVTSWSTQESWINQFIADIP